MRLPVIILAVTGVVAVAMLMLDARNPSEPAAVEAQPVAVTPSEPAVAEAPARPAATEIAPPIDGSLEREPPRQPLSDLALAKPPKPKEPEWKGLRLDRPTSPAAGLVEARGFTIAIGGLEPLAPGARCGVADWPCGAMARTAFRAWLRGRSVECDLPPTAAPGRHVSRCRRGQEDAGAWLVRNGWASANGSRYAEEEKAALDRKAGQFGSPL